MMVRTEFKRQLCFRWTGHYLVCFVEGVIFHLCYLVSSNDNGLRSSLHSFLVDSSARNSQAACDHVFWVVTLEESLKKLDEILFD